MVSYEISYIAFKKILVLLGFIRECLKSYNYNTAEVISAILDENLLPHLNNLPRDLIYVPPEPQPQQPTLAYKGKKPDYKDAAQLLNDKSQVKEMKDFILKSRYLNNL